MKNSEKSIKQLAQEYVDYEENNHQHSSFGGFSSSDVPKGKKAALTRKANLFFDACENADLSRIEQKAVLDECRKKHQLFGNTIDFSKKD